MFSIDTPGLHKQRLRTRTTWECLLVLLVFAVLYNIDLDNIRAFNEDIGNGEVVVREKHDLDIDEKTPDGDMECIFKLLSFDRNGNLSTTYSNECVSDDNQLLNIMNSLAQDEKDEVPDDLVASFAIGSVYDNDPNNINSLSGIVDKFLAPHLEWRIMAERFEEFGSDNSTGRGNKLFYDPAIFSTSPAAMTRRSLLQQYSTGEEKAKRSREEEALYMNGIDFILERSLDQKVTAFAAALRRHQFPQEECAELEKRDAGRTFATYAAGKDFLGAMTGINMRAMQDAIRMGAPFVNLAPPVWARTYEFQNCNESNGMDCVFLPVFGGKCLTSRLKPSIKCLSRFKMGYNQNIVFPKNNLPQQVCQEGHSQFPALANNEAFDVGHYNFGTGPPNAFKKHCPSCDIFGDEAQKPTPMVVLNASIPLGIKAMKMVDIPIIDYISGESSSRTCTMEVPPLRCGDKYCCINHVSIPQNVLGEQDLKRPTVDILESSLSTYLTRFNRESRRRIARLHQPRAKAMDERNEGWEEALSSGSCATLHIRRGDNIDRCKEGQTHFCAMNLTLANYMSHAVPMLRQLDSKHVFVMTDDPDVASSDMLMPWQEKGYHFEVISGHNQYSDETYSDWDPFIESLHAAKYCRAVLGHHISTVSKLVFRLSCWRFGECPLVDMMENP